MRKPEETFIEAEIFLPTKMLTHPLYEGESLEMIITHRELFFDHYPTQLSSLNKEQIDGLNAILDAFAKHPNLEDIQQAAYMLATTWHETAQTFQPICERGKKDYFRRYNGRHGNRQPDDGYLYRGRGYVQLTFKDNYQKASEKLSRLTDHYPQGVDLVNYPEDALKPQIAADILLIGMSEGWFTSKKLSDYIGKGKCDYYNARKIINALDRAKEIENAAKKFETILQHAILQHATVQRTVPLSSPPPPIQGTEQSRPTNSALWNMAFGKEQT